MDEENATIKWHDIRVWMSASTDHTFERIVVSWDTSDAGEIREEWGTHSPKQSVGAINEQEMRKQLMNAISGAWAELFGPM